jgi:hypothetical protein
MSQKPQKVLDSDFCRKKNYNTHITSDTFYFYDEKKDNDSKLELLEKPVSLWISSTWDPLVEW